MEVQLFVSNVSASVRKAVGNQVVELGADTPVAYGQNWHQVQAVLLAELKAQLAALAPAALEARQLQAALQQAVSDNGQPKPSESTRAVPVESKTAPQCAKHGVAFVRFEKDGRSWWAHKAGEGWCNYSPTTKIQR